MSDIPKFSPDPELEELLDEDPNSLDPDTLIDVQLYKSKKLQAKRDAGQSDAKTEWRMLRPGDTEGDSVSASEPENASEQNGSAETETKTEASSNDRREETLETPESDNMIDYYKNLKKRLRKKGPGSPGNSSNETSSDRSESASPNTEEAPSSRTRDTVEHPPEKPVQIESSIPSYLNQVLDRLDQYHRTTLELKDEIANLREENARLKERLQSLEAD